MSRTLLAVHAHPDDESLTMGGTLAAAVRDGIGVTLVTCTLGEQGEVIGEPLAGLVAEEADQLGGYRLVELERACRALGVVDHRSLGRAGRFRDSGMAGTPSAEHRRAFVRADGSGDLRPAAVADLLTVLADVRPQILLTYDQDGGYGHPDHIAAYSVALEAAALAEVPRVLAVVKPRTAFDAAVAALPDVPGYRHPGPGDLGFLVDDDVVDVAVPIDESAAAARRAALVAHGTQVEVLGDDVFALSNRILQPLLPLEYYRVLSGPPIPAGSHDLFEGL